MSDRGTTQSNAAADLTTTNTTLLQLVQALNNLTTVITAGGTVGPEIVTQLTDIVTELTAAVVQFTAIVTALGELTTINTTLGAGNTAVTAITTELGVINTTLSTVFPLHTLTGSKTFNPPSIADKASTTTTVTVTGAVLGNYAVPAFSLDLTGLTLTAYVSAADTVTVVFANLTGGAVDLASGTLSCRVFG